MQCTSVPLGALGFGAASGARRDGWRTACWWADVASVPDPSRRSRCSSLNRLERNTRRAAPRAIRGTSRRRAVRVVGGRGGAEPAGATSPPHAVPGSRARRGRRHVTWRGPLRRVRARHAAYEVRDVAPCRVTSRRHVACAVPRRRSSTRRRCHDVAFGSHVAWVSHAACRRDRWRRAAYPRRLRRAHPTSSPLPMLSRASDVGYLTSPPGASSRRRRLMPRPPTRFALQKHASPVLTRKSESGPGGDAREPGQIFVHASVRTWRTMPSISSKVDWSETSGGESWMTGSPRSSARQYRPYS